MTPILIPRNRPRSPLLQSRSPPSSDAAANDAAAEIMQARGVYAGPTTKRDLVPVVKRLAKLVAAIVLVAMAASFIIKSIGRANQPDSDAPPARQDNASSTQAQPPETNTEADPAQRPLYVSESNPNLATLSELAQPWSSKRFFFRSLTLSKNVPALIIRLPGPASESSSYWAFSLEVPFSRCQFVYYRHRVEFFGAHHSLRDRHKRA